MEKYPLPICTPEEAGIPSGALMRFIDTLEKAEVCMHSFLVIRHGKICAEGYWKPYHVDKKHRIYSCSKSFVSLAIGFMADEGLISLNDRVIDYFQDMLPPEGAHPYLAQATIRDLLMMATPYKQTTYSVYDKTGWVKSFFTTKPTHLPGTVFYYDTSASHTLGALVERLTGMPFLKYLRPRLLDEIGFSEDAFCVKDPDGIEWGGSGVNCTTRDLAKVALTCMNHGVHNGKQLIPQWYIKEATSRQIDNSIPTTSVDSRQGYGYQFWRMRNNSFAFIGMGGQVAVCVPDKDLVVVTTGDDQWLSNDRITLHNAIWDEIYDHLSDEALPNDADNYNALCKRIDGLSIHTVKGENGSPVIEAVNHAAYQMDANAMDISRISFDFDQDGGTMAFTMKGEARQIHFGYGKNVPQEFPGYGYSSIASGAWVSESNLNICLYVIDFCNAAMKVGVCFKGDTVTIFIRKVAEGFLDEYVGEASGKKV